MYNSLSIDHVILLTALWWAFATVVAFVAAMVLWNKGSSEMVGKALGINSPAVRFTGAGALWCFTLLLFCTVRPDALKPHKNVMLIYAQPDPTAQGKGGNSIEVKNLDVDLSSKLTYELIRREAIFPLIPGDEGRLEFYKAIPSGSYELRITGPDPRQEGKETYRSISVNVPL